MFAAIFAAICVVCYAGLLEARGESSFYSEFQDSRARRLLGQHVEDDDGERLGTVKNLVLDLKSDQLRYVIVTASGVPGLSPKRVVPPQALSTATAKKNTLALSVSKVRWEKAPRFKGDLATLDQPASVSTIFEFYFGPTRDSTNTTKAGNSAHAGSAEPQPDAKRKSRISSGSLQLASDLLGKEVFDGRPEALGRISDLLVDLKGHKPALAIVSNARPFKKNQNFVVALRLFNASRHQLHLNANRTLLEQAPQFSEQVWTSAAKPGSAVAYRIDLEDGDKRK